MGIVSLQDLSMTELEALLMDETKKFTSAFHNGTPQDQKDILRKKIDELILLIEKKHKIKIEESTPPERNVDGTVAPGPE